MNAPRGTLKRATIGTGITAREVDLVPATGDSLRAYILAEPGHDFDARIAEIEAWAAPIDAARRARGGQVKGHDSREGYARRLVQLIGAVRAYIAEGDAARAARCAVDLGIVFDEMLMKAEWEHPALVGVKRRRIAESASENKETARILRVALAALLWQEATKTEPLAKVRASDVATLMDINGRTLDDYLAEARAAGLLEN